MSCKEYIYIVKPQDIIKDPCFQKVTEMLLLYATLKKKLPKTKMRMQDSISITIYLRKTVCSVRYFFCLYSIDLGFICAKF